MKNKFEERLQQIIIQNSSASSWEESVREWKIIDWEKDSSQKSVCLCGKCGLKHLFTIKNKLNRNILKPIGSSCIEKFGRPDLVKQAREIVELYNLLDAINGNKFITLSKEYFSEKVLKILYQKNAFKPTKYNKMDGSADYEFMVKMLRNRKKPTELQQRKINGIIAFTIIPFLKKELKVDKTT